MTFGPFFPSPRLFKMNLAIQGAAISWNSGAWTVSWEGPCWVDTAICFTSLYLNFPITNLGTKMLTSLKILMRSKARARRWQWFFHRIRRAWWVSVQAPIYSCTSCTIFPNCGKTQLLCIPDAQEEHGLQKCSPKCALSIELASNTNYFPKMPWTKTPPPKTSTSCLNINFPAETFKGTWTISGFWLVGLI